VTSALARDLSELLGSDSVSEDPADQSAYAHDMWPRQLIATRAGLRRPAGPLAIAWPSNTEQLASLVQYARAHGVRLTPYGAGSAVTGALTLERDVVAVDMKRLRTLHSVDVERGIAVADCGILGEHLEEQLQRRGATLGHFPSSIYCSTLGGWIATRSAGQTSGRYGKIEDMVLALEGVLASGEVFRAKAPTRGKIDMRSLLVGSEGLFGFLTRATMRIWPAPVTRRFASFSFESMERAWETIRAIYQAGLRPAVARLYDPFDTYIFKSGGRAHAPRTESAGRPRPISEFLIRRVLKRPELLNEFNERFGERVFGRSLLVLVFEAAPNEEVEPAFERAMQIARDGAGRDEGEALARRWLARRHAVSYRQPPTFARGLWVDTMEVAAPWSRLAALYHDVHAALARGGFVMAHMSHAYPDGCSIYFTFAGAEPDDSGAMERYLATWARALEAAHRAGGTIAHHHGVGRSKRGAMRLELGAGTDVISLLTRAADPGEIIVRGPLVPARGEGPEPIIPTAPPPPPFAIDVRSRLASVRADLPMATLLDELAAHAFTLPNAPREGTVGEWLASRESEIVMSDPADHLVAGWFARLPDGEPARIIPSPRRATGPDLFTLFANGSGRHGHLEGVTLRIRGNDERGPAWFAPCAYDERGDDPALTSWVDRAASPSAGQLPTS
jgi:alkyldihydroxyacetonephosphate synthase